MMQYVLRYDSNEICVYSLTECPIWSQRTNHQMYLVNFSVSCPCTIPISFGHGCNVRGFSRMGGMSIKRGPIAVIERAQVV